MRTKSGEICKSRCPRSEHRHVWGQGVDMRGPSRYSWQCHGQGVVFPYPVGSHRGASAGQSTRALGVDTHALVHVCLFPAPAPAGFPNPRPGPESQHRSSEMAFALSAQLTA